MTQTNNFIDDFKINSKPFKDFKAKDLKYVFLMDSHGDHSLLLPKLVRAGFRGEIIMNHNAEKVILPMALNSAHIIEKDAIMLKREPYYRESDVYDMMDRVVSYGYGKVVWLDENVGFKFLRNSHTIASASLELYIKRNNNIETIVYTSDMGNPKSINHYVSDMEFGYSGKVIISESTYANKPAKGKECREKDLQKMKTVIDKTCLEDNSKVLIPVFAFGRSMEILTNLYKIYGEDETFDIPVICDSPLLYEMMKVQGDIVTGDDKILFDKVVNWANVKFVKDHSEHKALVGNKGASIILSSSGMLDKGRSREHLKSIIGKQNCTILFCGYCGENTIGHKIKSGQKNIRIDGKNYKCNCNIVNLTSFSSHISHENLLKYLSSVNAEKIALVHGNNIDKILFKDVLEKELSKNDKTAKVIAVQRGTVVTF